MKTIFISDRVKEKLKEKHGVTSAEIDECFVYAAALKLRPLEDVRADHTTVPPTYWWLSRTKKRRLLKVVFVLFDDRIEIKTAFEPNRTEVNLYAKKAKIKV